MDVDGSTSSDEKLYFLVPVPNDESTAQPGTPRNDRRIVDKRNRHRAFKYSLPLKNALKSGFVRSIMFSKGNFREARDKCIVLPYFSPKAIEEIVRFLQEAKSHPHIVSVPTQRFSVNPMLALEVAHAVDFLHIPSMQAICCAAIAANFEKLKSFGRLPTSWVSSILPKLGVKRLYLAEKLLRSQDFYNFEYEM